MFYKIIKHEYDTGKLYVPSKLHTTLLGGEMHWTVIHAGLREKRVSVVASPELSDNELGITADVLDALSIPLDISYQLRIEKNHIRIGPVLGLLLAQSRRFFTERTLEKISDYALRYEEIHGLLYVFSMDGINFENNTVGGLYYSPGTSKSGPTWNEGIFPIPDSIFRRVALPIGILRKLKELTGNRIFNSFYFNKLDFWNIVSKNNSVKDNIPDTRVYKSFRDIEQMLDIYESLYIKPVSGTLGNGLVKIVKTKEGYSFQGKYDQYPTIINSREKAIEYVNQIISDYRYLVQQDIQLLRYKGCFIDFRVNMQKDYTMKWNCTGIIGCIGIQGGIHSNYTEDGEYLPFEDFLVNELALGNVRASRKKDEIIELCKKVCQVLDETGENYGDLGIDVGLDQSLKPWIFEANKTQFYSLPLMLNDFEAYYAARTNPVKYAAALSGFNVQKV